MPDFWTPKIAAGWDNPGGLEYLHLISSPLFKLYAGGCKLEWHPYRNRELDGDLILAELGKPWAAWIFARLTRPEFRLLKNLGPKCTIRTYDTVEEVWRIGNAVMHPPEPHSSNARSEIDYWLQARFEFIKFEELT